jgi:hypothetical protein
MLVQYTIFFSFSKMLFQVLLTYQLRSENFYWHHSVSLYSRDDQSCMTVFQDKFEPLKWQLEIDYISIHMLTCIFHSCKSRCFLVFFLSLCCVLWTQCCQFLRIVHSLLSLHNCIYNAIDHTINLSYLILM